MRDPQFVDMSLLEVVDEFNYARNKVEEHCNAVELYSAALHSKGAQYFEFAAGNYRHMVSCANEIKERIAVR